MSARKIEPKDRKIAYRARPSAAIARPSSQGLRPHLWLSGPDPQKHDQYRAFLVHRAQAHYRGELHELSFEEWCIVWDLDDSWPRRGRQPEDLCLTRLDFSQAWRMDNLEIISRREQLVRQAAARLSRGVKYKPRKDKGSKRLHYVKKNV